MFGTIIVLTDFGELGQRVDSNLCPFIIETYQTQLMLSKDVRKDHFQQAEFCLLWVSLRFIIHLSHYFIASSQEHLFQHAKFVRPLTTKPGETH